MAMVVAKEKANRLTADFRSIFLRQTRRFRTSPSPVREAPSFPSSCPRLPHQPDSPSRHSAPWHRFFIAFGHKASNCVPVKRASTVSQASIGLHQATLFETASSKHLVTKGVKAQRQVGFWLFGCSAWVFSMVIIGGVTRLTKSGLSMTDWKFMGSFPPMSTAEWQAEFEKYQHSPEYKRVNKDMSVDNFKLIYWIEYGHRMWGRGLGLFFTGPLVYFLSKGFITKQLGLRLASLLTLGVGQGLVGWWMVKSGLEEPASEYHQPKVSPYRLASHLMVAFGLYTGLLWTSLSVIWPRQELHNIEWVRGAARLRRIAVPAAILIGLTAASGAFVAGNDAGHAFNTFPKMGDDWIPEGLFALQPLTRNFFENTATVQFDHRVLATTTLGTVLAMSFMASKVSLDPWVRKLVRVTMGMSILQVTLGISTLLLYVPVSLGVAHQAGALSLFTSVIALLHALRKPSPAVFKSISRPSSMR